MIEKIKSSGFAMMTAALILVSGLFVANARAAEPGTVTMTVTAVGKKDTSPPVVTQDDVQAFFAAQPDNTYISVSYARNGTAMVAQDFTNDHELAAKALRIPLGSGGAFTSPYLALLDLMKRWPTSADRHSILLFSSGIDYFRGDFWTRPPDLDSTISRAQKENINVWTIYAPDAGHRGRGFFVANRAQAYLSELSDATGAESFYLGIAEPVTLKPYFDELSTHLSNQYLLTFKASGGPKGRFERVHIATELTHVEFLAPSQTFLPPAK